MNKYNKIINLSLSSKNFICLNSYINNTNLYLPKANIILNMFTVFNLYYGLVNFLIINNLSKLSVFLFNFLNDMTVSHHISTYYNFKIINILKNLYINSFNYIFIYKTKNIIPVFSLSHIYLAANWLEREIYDMFGLLFLNHFDLRRILNDYGFKGFPMLKDFPVFGYKELWYNIETQQLMYFNVRLSQSWRFYFFGTQWKKNN